MASRAELRQRGPTEDEADVPCRPGDERRPSGRHWRPQPSDLAGTLKRRVHTEAAGLPRLGHEAPAKRYRRIVSRTSSYSLYQKPVPLALGLLGRRRFRPVRCRHAAGRKSRGPQGAGLFIVERLATMRYRSLGVVRGRGDLRRRALRRRGPRAPRERPQIGR